MPDGEPDEEKLQRKTLPEAFADRVLADIGQGRYRPGDRLPADRELGQRLGVGRTSVREGLHRLEGLGVVSAAPGRGTFVQAVTVESLFRTSRSLARLVRADGPSLADILAVRKVIEHETARLAASTATEGQLDAMGRLVEAMRGVGVGDPLGYLRLDLDFHIQIAEATGNSVFGLVVGLLRDLYFSSEIAARVETVEGAMDRSCAQHVAIHAALGARRGEEAAARMDEHLDYSLAVVLRVDRQMAGERPHAARRARGARRSP